MKHYKPKKLKIKMNRGRASVYVFRDMFVPHLAVDTKSIYNYGVLADLVVSYLDGLHSGYVSNHFRRFRTYRVPESFIDFLHTTNILGLVPVTIHDIPYYKLRDTDRSEVPENYTDTLLEVITGKSWKT